jgi:hypothetical protein
MLPAVGNGAKNGRHTRSVILAIATTQPGPLAVPFRVIVMDSRVTQRPPLLPETRS